jgi:transposase InsO family protein
VVIDCYSRRVVGWAMAEHRRAELVVEALEMAVFQRKPTVGLVHHSDQGSQYTALVFGQRCREVSIDRSMGACGCALDNAVCESFFASIKGEAPAPLLADPTGRAPRRVHVDRGLVQPPPAALHARLPLAPSTTRT